MAVMSAVRAISFLKRSVPSSCRGFSTVLKKLTGKDWVPVPGKSYSPSFSALVAVKSFKEAPMKLSDPPGSNPPAGVAAQQGSYLTNSAKYLGRHCFHTFRYNNFGLVAPLGAEKTTTQLPGYARFYRRGEKPKKWYPERNKNIRDPKKRLLCAKVDRAAKK